MSERLKGYLVCVNVGIAVIAIILSGLIISDKDISLSERRKLSQFPKLNIENVFSGGFMEDFESYSQDQFPFREAFRKLKALVATKIFAQKDNNGIYVVDDFASTIDGELKPSSINYASERFRYIVNKYDIDEDDVFISIIPDKNYFLAEANDYPHMDYTNLKDLLLQNLDDYTYIDIIATLSLDDYYMTDTHWKQECIIDTANALKIGLGKASNHSYEVKEIQIPFYGVYYRQSALSLKPDKLKYLHNNNIEGMKAFVYDEPIPIYDIESYHEDMYEMFLAGPESIVTIENPMSTNAAELVVFRDSFGSAIAPLLAEEYRKVTLIDIRYIRSDVLDKYIDFENAQVLFLYSTSVLNNSETSIR